MGGKDLPLFIEPPIPSSKRVKSPSTFIESLVKVLKRRIEIVSPHRHTKKPTTYDFIASPLSSSRASNKISSKKRELSSKTLNSRKMKIVHPISLGDHDSGFDDNGGGFSQSSPVKDYPVKDAIDWSITSDEIETLKSKVVPIY